MPSWGRELCFGGLNEISRGIRDGSLRILGREALLASCCCWLNEEFMVHVRRGFKSLSYITLCFVTGQLVICSCPI